MIWESWHWKKPLLDMARRLRKLKISGELSEEQLAQIERDIFIGFYSVRKLIETVTKVSDSAKTLQVKIGWFHNRKEVNWRNNHKIDDLYDLGKTNYETRDIIYICGRIIHSFIFVPVLDESGLKAILFTSDTEKNKKLYSLEIDYVINIFERIGNDNPTKITWNKDPKTGEETTVVE